MELLEDNRLFKKLDLDLNCSVDQLRDYFETNVGQGQTYIGIKRLNKEFQGSVGWSSFKIYRSMTMFDSNSSRASGVTDKRGFNFLLINYI